MKVLMITGNHRRHLEVVHHLLVAGLLSGLVLEERENMIPEAPSYLSAHDKQNFKLHFQRRSECEDHYFTHGDVKAVRDEVPNILISPEELNGDRVHTFLEKQNPDLILSYGPGLLKSRILNLFPERFFNLHGGFSPWYKGSATMFWPFYFLRPNWAGMTLHRTVQKIDAGEIIHHSFPVLAYGDGIHDVACKATLAATEDLVRILPGLTPGQALAGVPQTKNGKLFLDADWAPEMLRLIYDCYDDHIVDAYLNGEIPQVPVRGKVNWFSRYPTEHNGNTQEA